MKGGERMPFSLTKEQIMELFEQRQSQFADAVAKRMKPEFPFTVKSNNDLAGRCALVVAAFLEVVFAEDT